MTRERAIYAAAVGTSLMVLAACGSSSNPTGAAPTAGGSTAATGGGSAVIVGSANLSENQLLADIYIEALKVKGVKTSAKLNSGAREVYIPALKDGSIDLIPEYSGNLLAYVDKSATQVTSAAIFAALLSALPSSLEVLQQSAAQDEDAIVVTAKTAAKYHLTSIADLASVAGKLVLGAGAEFETRVDGIPGLKKDYGVTFKTFKTTDSGGPVTVAALKNGQIDAADLFTTDPSITQNHDVILKDPKNPHTAQNVLPLIRTAKATPTVVAALNAVSAKLTTSILAGLDSKVYDKQDPDAVAKTWLASVGLS